MIDISYYLLSYMGFIDTYINCSKSPVTWFHSYFDRTQEVKICNDVSKCKPIRTGIGKERYSVCLFLYSILMMLLEILLICE